MPGKTAFLFPGQGTVPEVLPPSSPLVDRLLAQAAAAGIDLKELIQDRQRIALTEFAQPAILIDSLAKDQALRAAGFAPDVVAGHSLGEYAALASSGVISPADALSVVIARGRLMGHVPGAMAAILKLDREEVEEVCAATGTSVANYNAPGQIVISGEAAAIEAAMRLAKERGGRAVRLNVSGPFHSPAMAPAQAGLAPRIEALEFRRPQVPVISGVSGKAETDPTRLKELLLTQITACVRWEEAVNAMVGLGVRTAIEVGPGEVLTRIGRRITDRIEFLDYEEVSRGRA